MFFVMYEYFRGTIMKKRMSILTLFMALLLLVTVGAGKVAKAENQTLTDYDGAYEIADMLMFNFDKSTLVTPAGFEGATSESTKKIPDGAVDFVYPSYLDSDGKVVGGLNYFGEPVTVTITVEYKGKNGYYDGMREIWPYAEANNPPYHDDGGVWITADKDVEIETFGTKYDITISFTDKDGKPFKFTGATVIYDPDEADFVGFTSDEIYYLNSNFTAPSWGSSPASAVLSDYYEYDSSRGLIRKDSIYDQLSPNGVNVRWMAFENTGTFGVLIKDSDTFSYTIDGKDEYLIMPNFFIVYVPYNIEYYYMVDGEYLDEPDDAEERGPVYILEEDDDHVLHVMNPLPNVETIEGDLDPQKTGYVLDSDYNGNAWLLRLKADGSTTLKVYFKQVYEVIYHDNGDRYGWTPGDAFADQKKSDYEYPETVVSFEGTPTKEGYTFLGWSKDPNDKTTLYTTEEVMQFFARDHHDYWAQWKKNENYVVPNTSVR